MKYPLPLCSPHRLVVMAALMGALSSPAAWAQVSARVEGLIADADAVRALPGTVLCRTEALQAGGSWLLVSRSWGGSPTLRHQQLVAWKPGQPQPKGRVNVAWRDCAKQA